jgi:hypothetical protein
MKGIRWLQRTQQRRRYDPEVVLSLLTNQEYDLFC